MNPNRYQVVEWTKNSPYGVDNRIVASSATLKGCLSQYNKHLKAWQLAKLDRNLVATKFYCDAVEFEVVL
jgi:hypothetical protein